MRILWEDYLDALLQKNFELLRDQQLILKPNRSMHTHRFYNLYSYHKSISFNLILKN